MGILPYIEPDDVRNALIKLVRSHKGTLTMGNTSISVFLPGFQQNTLSERFVVYTGNGKLKVDRLHTNLPHELHQFETISDMIDYMSHKLEQRAHPHLLQSQIIHALHNRLQVLEQRWDAANQ